MKAKKVLQELELPAGEELKIYECVPVLNTEETRRRARSCLRGAPPGVVASVSLPSHACADVDSGLSVIPHRLNEMDNGDEIQDYLEDFTGQRVRRLFSPSLSSLASTH